MTPRDQPDEYMVRTELYDQLGVLIQTSETAPPDESATPQFSIVRNINEPANRRSATFGPFYASSEALCYEAGVPDSARYSETTYDELGRPLADTRRTRSHGDLATTYGYRSNAMLVYNLSGATTMYRWDAAGRVIDVYSWAPGWSDWHCTVQRHNPAGDVVTARYGWTSYPDYDTYTRQYDRRGSMIEENGPDAGTYAFSWHANGAVKQTTEPDAKLKTNAFDGLGRVLSTTYSRTGSVDARGYDSPAVANAAGRITSLTAPQYSWLAQGYDERGRCVADSVTIANVHAAAAYVYRPGGELDGMSYPEGGTATFSYFPGTRIPAEATISYGSSTLRVVYSDYVPTGMAKTVEYFNGSATDPFLRVARDVGYADGRIYSAVAAVNPESVSPDTVMAMTYSYLVDGNVDEARDGVKGDRLGLSGPFTTRYEYDFAGRLVKEYDNGASTATRENVYNSAHARITSRKSVSRTMTYNYDPDRPHRIVSVGLGRHTYPFAYDSRGNIVGDAHFEGFTTATARTFTFDERGQASTITIPGSLGMPDIVETCTYSPDGLMIRQTDTLGNSTFRPYAFYEILDDETLRYLTVSGAAEAYVHDTGTAVTAAVLVKDRHDNVRAVVQADGTVKAEFEYDTWGQVSRIVDNDLANRQFETKYYHERSMLHDFGPRKYDSSYATFLSPDLFTANVLDPLEANRYAYARFNPNRYNDKSGHVIDTVTDGISLGMGAVSLYHNVKGGNYGAAAVDACGVVLDGVALAVPCVPAFGAVSIKAIRSGKAAKTFAKWSSEAVDFGRPVLNTVRESKVGRWVGKVFRRGGDEAAEATEAVSGKSHRHHSDPKFMGGRQSQELTTLPEATHKKLHRDMNDFLRQREDAMGNHMRPQRGNSGARIRGNFTRQERLEALRDFYKQYENTYPEAARDFFKQHPNL